MKLNYAGPFNSNSISIAYLAPVWILMNIKCLSAPSFIHIITLNILFLDGAPEQNKNPIPPCVTIKKKISQQQANFITWFDFRCFSLRQ